MGMMLELGWDIKGSWKLGNYFYLIGDSTQMIIKEVWKWEQGHGRTGYCDVMYCFVMKNSQEYEETEEKIRIKTVELNEWIEVL